VTTNEELLARSTTVEEALSRIRSGSRIFLGSGCAQPETLVRGLCAQADRLRDIEVCSLLTLGSADYVNERFLGHFRHNAFFIGSNVRAAVRQGRADYTPIFLSEIPELFRSGQQRVDVALLQVSPPDRHGFCNLGIHVDIQLAAIESAGLVIAEINPNVPRTCGASTVPLSRLDACVETRNPILEMPQPELDETSMEIGMHVARLVDDGSCLQLGIGAIPNAVARFLDDRRSLGLHTEMFSDGVLGLLENGNIDNSRKEVLPGRSVTSFAMGTRRLYDFVGDNPAVEFHPSDFVNDPRVISRNDQVVAINSALQVDLTGQVCADSLGYDFYSGIGGQVDFVRGAAMSRGGKPIIALPSTAKGGSVSRIAPHLDEGAGVVTSRGDVHYVVTEYGMAYLHGKTIRERALALINVAHPDFRPELRSFVQRKHYASVDPGALRRVFDAYPADQVHSETFGDQAFTVRPLRPDDAGRLRDFFYSHTLETIYHRYFTVKKDLTADEALHLCSVDFRERMAFGVFSGAGDTERIVGVARYDLDPRTNLAETAIVVGEDQRKRGIGTHLLRLLCEYAEKSGIAGITATILAGNQSMVRIHRELGHRIRWDGTDRRYHVRHLFGTSVRDRDDATSPVNAEPVESS
jgi:acyl-CoA hydrolase/ribosomal protein S18 acetylase RimI-like enzyme